MLPGLVTAVDRLVRSGYRGGMYGAVKADPMKPRFARVPSGATTCGFCLMLASRGFVYLTAESAGKLNKYHSHCDCVPVASWEKHPLLAGYDPDALYQQYLAAKDQTGSTHGGSVSGVLDDGRSHVQSAADPLVAEFGEPGTPNSIDDAVRRANPLYDPAHRDYSENCQRVVLAYEARRRGFDVAASKFIPGEDTIGWLGAQMPGLHERIWAGAITVGQDRLRKTIVAAIEKWPEGARGVVLVKGHVFSAERMSDGVRFVDAQAGQAAALAQQFSRGVIIPKRVAPNGHEIRAFVARVDDLPFDPSAVAAMVKP
jgi:hypothetical protein